MACVDSAIWDAVGKALGMPLYRLWGGYRNELPIIAIGGYYDRTYQELADEMLFYQRLGLAGCKLRSAAHRRRRTRSAFAPREKRRARPSC